MILVTGATGNVEREVVKVLLEDGKRWWRSPEIPPSLSCPAAPT